MDTEFCTSRGAKESPVRNKKLGEAKFGDTTIKQWIENLHSKDLLAKFDREIDGSVGGLGNKMEKVLGADREVPLFEFRDLDEQYTTTMVDFVKDVDQKLKNLHQKYKEAPSPDC